MITAAREREADEHSSKRERRGQAKQQGRGKGMNTAAREREGKSETARRGEGDEHSSKGILITTAQLLTAAAGGVPLT